MSHWNFHMLPAPGISARSLPWPLRSSSANRPRRIRILLENFIPCQLLSYPSYPSYPFFRYIPTWSKQCDCSYVAANDIFSTHQEHLLWPAQAGWHCCFISFLEACRQATGSQTDAKVCLWWLDDQVLDYARLRWMFLLGKHCKQMYAYSADCVLVRLSAPPAQPNRITFLGYLGTVHRGPSQPSRMDVSEEFPKGHCPPLSKWLPNRIINVRRPGLLGCLSSAFCIESNGTPGGCPGSGRISTRHHDPGTHQNDLAYRMNTLALKV